MKSFQLSMKQSERFKGNLKLIIKFGLIKTRDKPLGIAILICSGPVILDGVKNFVVIFFCFHRDKLFFLTL